MDGTGVDTVPKPKSARRGRGSKQYQVMHTKEAGWGPGQQHERQGLDMGVAITRNADGTVN